MYNACSIASENRTTAGTPVSIFANLIMVCRSLTRGSKYESITFHKMEERVGRLLCFVLVAVVFQSVQVQIASAVACAFVSGNKCKCVLVDGSGEIDLSPLFAGGKLSVQGTGPE